MVKSTCFQHTSSHPDKYNNSMNRIISKEEEREDPRRDTSIYLRVQNTVVFPHTIQHSYKNYSISTRNPASFQSSRAILHTELILLQEFSKKHYNYKGHPVQVNTRHLPATVSHVSKHSTWQNKAPGSPTSIPGPYSKSRLPVNSTRQKQHSKQQPASMQLPTVAPRCVFLQNSTRRNRILSKRVKYCMSMQY